MELSALSPKAHDEHSKRVVGGRYELCGKLGSGASSVVWRALDTKRDKLVAVKSIALGEAKDLPGEARVLQQLPKHRNVVRLRRVACSPHHTFLVQDLHQGDVFDLILAEWARNGRGWVGLRAAHASALFADLLAAVHHLHQHGVAHRDVKPENCLLADDGRLVLADFEFATRSTSSRARCGTLEYMAPEMVRDLDAPYDPRLCDVWACGVALFAMLTARLPFDAPTELEVRENIAGGEFVFPDTVGPSARDLVSRLLRVDPSERPSVADVLDHPFLAHHHHHRLPTSA